MSGEVPEGWTATALGEITQITGGSTPSKSEGKYWESGTFCWATPSDITALDAGFPWIKTTKNLVTDAAIRETSLKLLPTGSVLMTSRATVGFPAVNLVPMATNQGFATFLPASTYDAGFLVQWITWKRNDLRNAAGGSTFPEISKSTLKSFPIALPSLPEQRRIAEILSSVDEAIAATRAVIEQTRKVKQAVLERLLTKGIGHARFKQTEIGEIPEEWEVRRLEDIASIDRGKFSVRPRNDPHYFGGDIPFVQTGDVVAADGRLVSHSQTLNRLGKEVSREFPSGTVLVTIAANIGDTAITTYPVCCPDSVVGIVPHFETDVDWLREYLVLQKPTLNKQATQNAQKNINLQNLRPILVPTPSKKEQAEIGERIRTMNETIGGFSSELAALVALKSALMSDLLTGRKRITDALPLAAE